jgi:uncharacterized membrane protein (UPF0127 family)
MSMNPIILLSAALYALFLIYVFFYKSAADSMEATIKTGSGDDILLRLEVANTLWKKMRGLMGRKHLNLATGMLFPFWFIKRPSFWMKSTPLPLDIVFVSKELRITEIREDLVPMSTQRIVPKADCRYVIELNAGFCRTHGISAGDMVLFHSGAASKK